MSRGSATFYEDYLPTRSSLFAVHTEQPMLTSLFLVAVLVQNPGIDKPIELVGHTSVVWSLSWNPKTGHLATANQDELIVWNTNFKGELEKSKDAYDPISFSTNGSWLAVTTRDGVALLNPKSLQVVRQWTKAEGFELSEEDEYVSAVGFGSDDKLLVIGTSEGAIFRIDLESGEVKRAIGHETRVTSIAISKSGKRMATTGLDRKAKLWDTTTWTPVRIEQFLEPVTCACFSSDGAYVAFGADDGAIKLLSSADGKLISSSIFSGSVSSLDFISGDRLIATGSSETEKGSIWIFGEIELKSKRKFAISFWPWVAKTSPIGNLIAIGGDNGKVFVFDIP